MTTNEICVYCQELMTPNDSYMYGNQSENQCCHKFHRNCLINSLCAAHPFDLPHNQWISPKCPLCSTVRVSLTRIGRVTKHKMYNVWCIRRLN